MKTNTRADLIIHNADVRGMSPAQADATAVAVEGRTITAVGSDTGILALAKPQTRVIDADGGTLLPGFCESHMHLFDGGMALRRLNLATVFGAADLKAAVDGFARRNPDEGLLVGYGANYAMFGNGTRISRSDLDAACPDRPFFMIATDYHTGWANTVALQQAGLMHGRHVGPNAEVVMGADGLATGELREQAAMACVMALRTSGGRESLGMSGFEPEAVTAEEREEDLQILADGLAHCARHGITKIINMDGNRYQLELLATLEARGALPCRIEVPNRIPDDPEGDPIEKTLQMTRDCGNGKITGGRVKMFMDGVFDSWTAVVVGDYPDCPGFSGEPILDQETFNDRCIRADRAGLQISVHAVGDGAVRMVLDGYEAARRANGPRDSRHRIEHIDTIVPDDIPRIADLGVIASMQPVHVPGSAGLPLEPTTGLMGRDRWPWAFNWRAIADAGATIAFGTDWPISPLDPLYAIQCALTRQAWADDLPDPRLSLGECLAAYTVNGAYAAFDEDRLGRIEPDMLADLVLLRGDVESLAEEGDLRVSVELTVCDGVIIHEAAG